MTIDKQRQRGFFLGAGLEAIGLLALVARFAAHRGGAPLLVIGSFSLGIGLALQILAISSAPRR